MKARTEDDILSRAPIVAKLGDKDYSIPLLAVMDQREWRKKLFAELAPVLSVFVFNPEGMTVADALTAALLQFPEKLCDLVFLYTPELPKDDILANATEEQIVTAFSAIMNVAFPFVPEIKRAMKILTSVA
jgi:hypothetical protein